MQLCFNFQTKSVRHPTSAVFPEYRCGECVCVEERIRECLLRGATRIVHILCSMVCIVWRTGPLHNGTRQLRSLLVAFMLAAGHMCCTALQARKHFCAANVLQCPVSRAGMCMLFSRCLLVAAVGPCLAAHPALLPADCGWCAPCQPL
jgi:hypothetical protein